MCEYGYALIKYIPFQHGTTLLMHALWYSGSPAAAIAFVEAGSSVEAVWEVCVVHSSLLHSRVS